MTNKQNDFFAYPRVSASDIQRRPGALTRYMQTGTPVLVTHYDVPVGVILPVDNALPEFNLYALYRALVNHWKQIGTRNTPDDFTPLPRKSRSKKNVAPVVVEE